VFALSGLLDALNAILCTIENLALSILAVIVMAFNGVIVAVGAFVDVIVSALPNWGPTQAHWSSGILAWVNWLLPVDVVVTLWTTMISIAGTLMLVRVAARWVKLL
jgi:hypothetical protein